MEYFMLGLICFTAFWVFFFSLIGLFAVIFLFLKKRGAFKMISQIVMQSVLKGGIPR